MGGCRRGDDLDIKVSRQAEQAVDDADLALFVVDVAVGVTAEDEDVADWLRRRKTPVAVIANKVDGENRETRHLGVPRRSASVIRSRSARCTAAASGDMLDEILAAPAGGRALDGTSRCTEFGDRATTRSSRWRSSAGRTSASRTLFNRLVGEDRSIVHDMPGTTRDAIDTVIETDEGPLRFVDTAGMRRKSRIDEGSEYFSMVRSLAAIDRADVAVLLIDATEGMTHQDQRLAERVDAGGCAVVDRAQQVGAARRRADAADVMAQLADRFHFLAYAPVLKMSALTGLGVHKLMPALREAVEAYHRRIPTRELNLVIQGAQAAHAAARRAHPLRHAGRDRSADVHAVHEPQRPAPYLRYLERKIREHFGFGPAPLKLRVRRKSRRP